jgi:EF-P beta-lysylation protein EpmB
MTGMAETPHAEHEAYMIEVPIIRSSGDMSIAVAAGSALIPWRRALREAVRDPVELCQLLELPVELQAEAIRAARLFPVFAPHGYIARMRRKDPHDPLLRQVLPLGEELVESPGFVSDPVGDRQATQTPGLLQKYASRVLMVTTGACAVHCRYCFRRHFPYSESPKSLADWQPALEQIADDKSLHEVLLSGGDPLTLVDEKLSQLASQISQIRHIKRLRIHTRLPIMIPERVTDELLVWLTATRLTPVMVIHANHAAEIDSRVAAAIERLVAANVVVLNQSVLLAGVNDSAEALAELSERLLDVRVMPYYLHQLDRVSGAAHFEVPEARGLEIVTALRRRLPGYAVPRYVREIAGQPHKTVLA